MERRLPGRGAGAVAVGRADSLLGALLASLSHGHSLLCQLDCCAHFLPDRAFNLLSTLFHMPQLFIRRCIECLQCVHCGELLPLYALPGAVELPLGALPLVVCIRYVTEATHMSRCFCPVLPDSLKSVELNQKRPLDSSDSPLVSILEALAHI